MRPVDTGPADLAAQAMPALGANDPELYDLLAADLRDQARTLSLLATASLAPPEVLAAAGSAIGNVPAQGYAGRRLAAGSTALDAVEELAVERAKAAFAAKYVNVQPHSGSAANLSVYSALLRPGDTVLCLDPAWGGPHAHGSPTSVSGQLYRVVTYGLNGVGRIDHEQLAALARQSRPALIVCTPGVSPRVPDYAAFRAVADSVGAYLLADISTVGGLVAAGAQPNPIDHAHVTTCCISTFGGPQGGLVMSGADAESPGPAGREPLRTVLRSAVFPSTQGAPSPAGLAAMAAALRHVRTPESVEVANRSVANGTALATLLLSRGREVLSHGTDHHTMWINVAADGMTGMVAERALESCGLLVSRNRVPFDVKPPPLGSGIRLGTLVLSQRGMKPRNMAECAELILDVLTAIAPRSDTEFELGSSVRRRVRDGVSDLCHRFPAHFAYGNSRPRLVEAA